MTWLERRYPKQWGRRDRMQVEHSGSVDLSVIADLRTVIVEALDGDLPAQIRIADALDRYYTATSSRNGASEP